VASAKGRVQGPRPRMLNADDAKAAPGYAAAEK